MCLEFHQNAVQQTTTQHSDVTSLKPIIRDYGNYTILWNQIKNTLLFIVSYYLYRKHAIKLGIHIKTRQFMSTKN